MCEVGAGAGTNFVHYPAAVTEVVAVEPEPYLRELARAAAAEAAVPVRVVDGVADALPLDDAACNAIVHSLVLCSVPSVAGALAEARRVLRPGGELRFYEHVAAPAGSWLARVQRTADASGVWPKLAGGCHAHRDTAGALRAAGFDVEVWRAERHRAFGPVSPHVIGRAVPLPR